MIPSQGGSALLSSNIMVLECLDVKLLLSMNFSFYFSSTLEPEHYVDLFQIMGLTRLYYLRFPLR